MSIIPTWLAGHHSLLHVAGCVAEDGVEQGGLAHIGAPEEGDFRDIAEVRDLKGEGGSVRLPSE